MKQITRRERQILELVVSGKLNKEIANTLTISESTVKNHIYSLMTKFNVKNRTELTMKYWQKQQPSIWARLLSIFDRFP